MDRYKLQIVNNHGDRYIRCDPAPDGSWVMFRDVAALQKRCEEAERERDALATARREGMEQAAQIADSCAADWRKSARATNIEYTKWKYEDRADAGEEIAAAIRAAAKEGKQ